MSDAKTVVRWFKKFFLNNNILTVKTQNLNLNKNIFLSANDLGFIIKILLARCPINLGISLLGLIPIKWAYDRNWATAGQMLARIRSHPLFHISFDEHIDTLCWQIDHFGKFQTSFPWILDQISSSWNSANIMTDRNLWKINHYLLVIYGHFWFNLFLLEIAILERKSSFRFEISDHASNFDRSNRIFSFRYCTVCPNIVKLQFWSLIFILIARIRALLRFFLIFMFLHNIRLFNWCFEMLMNF